MCRIDKEHPFNIFKSIVTAQYIAKYLVNHTNFSVNESIELNMPIINTISCEKKFNVVIGQNEIGIKLENSSLWHKLTNKNNKVDYKLYEGSILTSNIFGEAIISFVQIEGGIVSKINTNVENVGRITTKNFCPYHTMFKNNDELYSKLKIDLINNSMNTFGNTTHNFDYYETFFNNYRNSNSFDTYFDKIKEQSIKELFIQTNSNTCSAHTNNNKLFVIRRGLNNAPLKGGYIAHSGILQIYNGKTYLLEYGNNGVSQKEIMVHDIDKLKEFENNGEKWTKQINGCVISPELEPKILKKIMTDLTNSRGDYHLINNNCHMAQESVRKAIGLTVDNPYKK
jgi:hypothetical protein